MTWPISAVTDSTTYRAEHLSVTYDGHGREQLEPEVFEVEGALLVAVRDQWTHWPIAPAQRDWTADELPAMAIPAGSQRT